MLRRLKNKKGNEILQVLVVIAVLGAVTVAICVAISNQLRSSTGKAVRVLNEGTSSIYGNGA